MRFGYVIERLGAEWEERFWVDMPAFNVRGFGDDGRARIFISKSDADKHAKIISEETGSSCYATKVSDLYPPAP